MILKKVLKMEFETMAISRVCHLLICEQIYNYYFPSVFHINYPVANMRVSICDLISRDHQAFLRPPEIPARG